MSITAQLQSARLKLLGTLYFDVSVDTNASFFFPPGKTLDATATADRGVLTGDTYSLFSSLLIVCVSTSLTGTVNLQTLGDPADDETADASWHIIQSGGSDIAIPANKAIVVDTDLAAPAIRLFSTGVEAADRTFNVYGRVRVTR